MFVLLAIFVLVPIAELYVILKVGDSIGWQWTLLLLIVDSLVGVWLMRSQGRAVWLRFQTAMQAGRIPHREVFDGVLVIFGGAFLITPGFITDIFGFALLLPPTRSVIRRLVIRHGGKMFGLTVIAGRRGPAPREWDVEGTAVETDQPRLEP